MKAWKGKTKLIFPGNTGQPKTCEERASPRSKKSRIRNRKSRQEVIPTHDRLAN